MKKYICFILLALVATCCLSSCEEVKGSPEEFQKKDKTVLVYMVANNDLSGNAITNFTDMQKGYVPSEDGNLVVYYHYPNQNPLLLNIYNNESGMVAIDTVYRFPARNSATPASLTSAINVTATYFPADEYGLILWSHATGWLPSGYYANNPKSDAGQFGHSLNGAFEDPYADIVKMVKESDAGILSRSFGSEAGSEIDLKDLVKALPFKFSFVIFDACLMGGIEVAYQFKDSTDYILFSPTETLAAGMPYSSIMTHLFKTPSDLTAVAQEYFNYYNYTIW